MKKRQTLTMLLAITMVFVVTLLFLPSLVSAGDLEPSTPPTMGTMHTLDEIFNKVGDNRTIVSAYGYANATGPVVLMTVPSDKKFILTDCLGNSSPGAGHYMRENIGEDSYVKILMVAKNVSTVGVVEYHFASGIPFGPNSQVVIDGFSSNSFTICGYLIDSE